MCSEVWKVVPSLGFIEASSLGRIRKGTHIYSESFKKMNPNHAQIRVALCGKRKGFFISRLVCEAFNGPPKSRSLHAAHKDGNPKLNTPDNLYWATAQQNIDDRERHGKTMRGDNHYAAKLKASDIPKIREMLSKNIPQTEIAKNYGVTNYAINDIKRGKSWKNA